jgi:hypothetical protein
MRFTGLLFVLPVVLAVPSPAPFANDLSGSSLAARSGLLDGSSGSSINTRNAVFSRKAKRDQAAEEKARLEQLQLANTHLKDFTNKCGVDLNSIASQADKTQNTAVGTGARAAATDLNPILPPIAVILAAVDATARPSITNLNTVANGIVKLETGITSLEKAIVNKDVDLSKFIANSVADVAVMREGLGTIMTLNNFNFTNGVVVEVPPPEKKQSAGGRSAVAYSIFVVACVLSSGFSLL